MYVSGDKIQGSLIFKILVDIPSYPREFLHFNEWIIFSISCVVVVFNFSEVKGWLIFCLNPVIGFILLIVFFSEEFMEIRFSATDEK